jgi:mannose-6-phosphate isomerase-like protein (cupin superfamily)
MSTDDDRIKLSFRDEAAKVAELPEPYRVVFNRNDVSALLFIPRDKDVQTPHDRDELYIVVSGKGTFRRGSELVRFVQGDVLFVGAHVPHRFESFSGDFKTWVIFFGPPRPKE